MLLDYQHSLFDHYHAQEKIDVGGLKDFLLDYQYQGQATIHEQHNGVDYFINEYWTAKQRQAHSIHEISYRACFKPQLPDFFIRHLTNVDDVVYDPFMGRGTTLIQAALQKRQAVGNDINPLSAMLVWPRFVPPSLSAITARLLEIQKFNAFEEEALELLVFYHPDTLKEIIRLKAWFIHRQKTFEMDRVDEWIRMICINRLTGHSSGFFSVYTLPPNQAVSLARQKRINAQREQIPPYRDVYEIILKKTRTLLKDNMVALKHHPRILTGDARKTGGIKDNYIDLLVTSPPFLDIVDYAGDNWLRCWFAGIDLEMVHISIHKKLETWQNFIHDCFKEFYRIMKPLGHIAFEVGEVKNGKVKLEDYVLKAIENIGFDVIGVMVNQQNFTKTANCWGVANNKQGTNSNRIVLLQKQ